jgi:hypothetical protein
VVEVEAYKTVCKDSKCGHVRFWSGYKTGLGKSDQQLEQMQRDQELCIQCGQPAKTELDMESHQGQALSAQAQLFIALLGLEQAE